MSIFLKFVTRDETKKDRICLFMWIVDYVFIISDYLQKVEI